MGQFAARKLVLAAMLFMLPPVLAASTMQVSTRTAIFATPALSLAAVSGSAASTSSAMNVSTSPKVHLVKAGSGGFSFKPDQLDNVSIGDVVTFEFYPRDHSVARVEYGSACMPYEYTSKDKTGFWSGTQLVDTVGDITHWNLTINSTEPIFYYCAAPVSCKEKWMLGAINPNRTQTLDGQIRAAQAAEFQVAPGEPVPKEMLSSSSSGTTSSATSSASPALTDRHPSGLSGGVIAGIVLGGVIFLVVCAGVLVYATRRMSAKAVMKPSETSCTMDSRIMGPRSDVPIDSYIGLYWTPVSHLRLQYPPSVPSELPDSQAGAKRDSKSWNL